MKELFEYKTSEEILLILATRIKRERISQNITQAEFSIKSGIALNTYKKLENKGKSTLENFLISMISLGKINDLAEVLKPLGFSPKQARLEDKTKKVKMRVKKVSNKIKDSVNETSVSYNKNISIVDSILNKFEDKNKNE